MVGIAGRMVLLVEKFLLRQKELVARKSNMLKQVGQFPARGDHMLMNL
jgi:hypothetical protein